MLLQLLFGILSQPHIGPHAAVLDKTTTRNGNIQTHQLKDNCSYSYSVVLTQEGWVSDTQSYSRFRVFSPDCTLHSAITHVILVLERQTPTHHCAIGIHVSLRRSHTFIMWVIAECSVQSGLKTLKRLYQNVRWRIVECWPLLEVPVSPASTSQDSWQHCYW